MSKCWYCNNELTSGDSPKHFGICNKCYDEMFKSSDTIISSFTNKISDLEVKLDESEGKRKSLEEKVKFITEEIEECFVDGQKYNELREQKDKEIQELKQQLAEKDKEIVRLNKFLQAMKIREQDQDKISFAVEQLEKVKEFFLEEHRDEEMDTDYIITKDAGEIADYLLDQIKQLKGEK